MNGNSSFDAHGDYAVVIPAFNAAATLRRALDSVFAQTLPPAEVVVVDDGSPDSEQLREIVDAYDGKVCLLRRRNGGPAAARNAGVRATHSDWVAFLDADDSWLPDKMARQLALATDAAVGLLHGSAREDKVPPPSLDFAMLWRCNRIVTSTAVVRREALLQLGGFDEDPALLGAEDYNLWLRIAHAGWRILACPGRVGDYTPAAGSITSQVQRCALAEIADAEKAGRQLHVRRELVERKIRTIRTDFCRHLLHVRNLREARRMAWPALSTRPTPLRLGLWSATFVPLPLLDALRRLRAQGRS